MRASLDARSVENTGLPCHIAMNAPVSFRRKQGAIIGYLVFTFALAGFSSSASAMYKCIGENGTPSFQDSPCQTAVHDKSNDTVIRTKAPIPIEEPKRYVPPKSQPEQKSVQMDTEQNVNATQPNTDDATVMGKTTARGKGTFLDFLPFLVVYLGFSALLGWWASARNRSFWNWFFLSLIFTPSLIFWIFLLFRGSDPERPAWANQ